MTAKLLRLVFCTLLAVPMLSRPGPTPAQTIAPARTREEAYRVFDAQGRRVTLQEVVSALADAEVVCVGELHDDPTAHGLEAELLGEVFARYDRRAAPASKRSVALSLEMFERDVQTVVDEYLAGLIPERHFLLSSRPWGNYETDYRPLVEFARERKVTVIASNAPARYVTRVARLGPRSLDELSREAKSWLPPLPFHPASEAYAAKFRRFMGGDSMHTPPAAQTPAAQAAHGASHLLDAQNLRDASMGHAVAEHLKREGNALVVHVNGRFHSEERLGVPEQILRYRPRTRVVVVTIVSGEGFPDFDAARVGRLGDFVILTDPTLPRTQ